MRNNYLVSVFVGGKNVNSYYSENLDDLVTIKALHKDAEISIFDLRSFTALSQSQVSQEIKKSGIRWKSSIEKQEEKEDAPKPLVCKPKKQKTKKYWERPVLCVETGQVFGSIRECSNKLGIPYMTITNCIKNGNATRGLHFMNAPKL